MGAESAASCALHSAPAVATCTYCGDFLCLACAVRPDDLNLPYCVECLKRREAHLSAEKLGDRSTRMHQAALGFGLLGLVPCFWFGWIGAFAAGIVTLRRDPSEEEARLAWIGMGLGCLGAVATFAVVARMFG